MNVAVCDDETIQARLIASYVEDWGRQTSSHVTVSCFSSAEAFWFAWSEDKSFDVLLLDIQMDGKNGMDLARELRKEDNNLIIVFVTGVRDYIGEGYEVNALHYLLKPIQKEKLFMCLDRACRLASKAPATVLVRCHGEVLRLLQEEIQYVEAFAHSVSIHMGSGARELPLSISNMRERLDSSLFLVCHRSYLVNVMHIKKITKSQLVLDCGEELPLSRRLAAQVNAAFLAYYRREAAL